MRALKIEHNIPLTSKYVARNTHNKNTNAITTALKNMSIGSSFVIGASHRMTVYNRANSLAVSVRIRKWGHNSIRVWLMSNSAKQWLNHITYTN